MSIESFDRRLSASTNVIQKSSTFNDEDLNDSDSETSSQIFERLKRDLSLDLNLIYG